MSRARAILLVAVLAALAAVPLSAVAVGEESDTGAQTAPRHFAVTATLLGCGRGSGGVICQVAVGFRELDDASSYHVSAVAPDGTVSYLGSLESGGIVSVPYSGDGSYGIEVQAFGPEPGGGERSLARAEADLGGRNGEASLAPTGESNGEQAEGTEPGGGADGGDPAPAFPGPSLLPPPAESAPGPSEPAPAPEPEPLPEPSEPAPVEPEPEADGGSPEMPPPAEGPGETG